MCDCTFLHKIKFLVHYQNFVKIYTSLKFWLKNILSLWSWDQNKKSILLFCCCFTSHSRIFHSYGDVTMTSHEWLQTISLYLVLYVQPLIRSRSLLPHLQSITRGLGFWGVIRRDDKQGVLMTHSSLPPPFPSSPPPAPVCMGLLLFLLIYCSQSHGSETH